MREWNYVWCKRLRDLLEKDPSMGNRKKIKKKKNVSTLTRPRRNCSTTIQLFGKRKARFCVLMDYTPLQKNTELTVLISFDLHLQFLTLKVYQIIQLLACPRSI